MTAIVFSALLFAALLHASWNALIRGGTNRVYDTALITLGAAGFAACGLAFVVLPAASSVPFLLASAAIHGVYFQVVRAAYDAGDMSHGYPLMRGVPPIIVALLSGPVLGETLSGDQWFAVAMISSGIVLMVAAGPRPRAGGGRALGWVLAAALVIALYTVNDGVGVRRAGAPVAYGLWMFLLTGVLLNTRLLWREGRAFVRYGGAHRRVLVVGGLGTVGAYEMTLWAMTRAPVASVAALRETSILFATVIAAFVLKEHVTRWRWAAALVILLGVVVMRLA